MVLPDGRLLNHVMVGQGMAWWYRRYAPNDLELAGLETEAKAAKRGLWGQPNPVPPWDWRRGVGVPPTAGVIGNRRSHIYHTPNCPSVARMSEKNRVGFGSEAEATKAGYRKAGDCGRGNRGAGGAVHAGHVRVSREARRRTVLPYYINRNPLHHASKIPENLDPTRFDP